MVIRRYISRWLLLFSGNKKVYFEVGVTFSGNKKVYFEVVVTL